MQGLAVVPIFAGYDLRRGEGRLFQYDVTGGRYEESNFASTGSGSLHAGTVIKLGYRTGLDRASSIDLVISALFQAADEDSATGGPDLVRGIFPTIATITRTGFDRVPESEIAERFGSLVERLATPSDVADHGVSPTIISGGDRA
jgi:proteasome beta subunit